MEFIFSNPARHKKSSRPVSSINSDKNNGVVASDSEMVVQSINRSMKNKRQQARNVAVEMTRNAEISVIRKETYDYSFFFDQQKKTGLEHRLSSLESSTGSINANFRCSKSANRNSMSSTQDSGLCSSSDISTAGCHSASLSDIEYEKGLSRRKSQATKSTSALKCTSISSLHGLTRPSSVSSMPVNIIATPSRNLRNQTITLRTTVVPPQTEKSKLRSKLRPQSRSTSDYHSGSGGSISSSGTSQMPTRMVRHQSSTLPGWDIVTAALPAGRLSDSNKTDQRIEEMVETEREYVKSLNYIIKHYLPEMERNDIPATLRGHRSALFGNLERIRDFHQDLLLPELERSKLRTSRIASIFLKYEAYLEMYALYVKNKPTSDRLLAESGKFFQSKQLELGDKMDLASYLLKPVQRLGKYSLFLDGISKTTKQKTELLKAKKIIQFQLQHGDNLLAMDSIKGCEIDLKEQGKLLRQNEFNVMSGRRKAIRRIFLFENLILFTKPKRSTQGGDIYQYKNSWLTSEVGLTANIDDPFKFEIWLRRRTREVLVIQSNDPTTKLDWVNEINGILLSQADKYREQRLKEMANMGVGNKPLMDIGGSNTITDRSVPIQTARLRNSIAMGEAVKSQSIPRNVSLFTSSSVKRRPNSLVSTAPSSDSSSMGLSRQCTVPSIFTKPEDMFDDEDSEMDVQTPATTTAYRQYETTV